MKLIRYQDRQGRVHYGQQNGRQAFRMEGDIFGTFCVTEDPADLHKLLAPVVPPLFYCIGLNYRQHAAESGAAIPSWPVLFAKGTNALQHPGDPVFLPRGLRSDKVDFEVELAVVIGRTCKNVKADNALEFVLGYTCGNDISARDWQKDFGGGQWVRGKSFDTFAPLGPCLVTADEIPDPNGLDLKLTLNGTVMQQSNTRDMIFRVPELIAFVSGSTTLLPGTVILTGTPSGVGMARKPPVWLRPGDEMRVEIEGIGELVNPIAEEP